MAPKKSPADLVVTSPEWQVPSREQLEEIDSGHIKNHVLKYNEGLRAIRIEVLDADKQAAGTIQKFELSIGEDGIPLLTPTLISQLIRARGIRYAIDEDRKVQFRVWLHGKSATTREWTQQLRFTVDPQISEDYQDAGEDEEEGDEGDEDDDFDGPDEDEGGDEEEDLDDDEDAAQAPAQNGRDRVMQPPTRQPDPRGMPPRPSQPYAQQPQPSYAQQPQYAAPEPRPLPATHVMHPSVAAARELGLEVKPENAQMQFSPDFMLALINAGGEQVLQVLKPMLKEFRMGMSTIRRESSRTSRESRMNARMVARAAVAQQRESSQRQTMLEDRLIKISELNYSHYENFQLIAQQGWTAFRNSMEKEAETYTRMREYDRALLGQQLTFERGTDRSSAAGGLLSGGAPIALMLGSTVMRMRGDEKSTKAADSLEEFAKLLLPNKRSDEDDDDEEEDDEYEDVIDTEPKAPPREAREHGNGHASTAAPPDPRPRRPSTTPAIMGARALLDSLSEKQIKDLRKILPAAAWQGVLDAANAEMEYSALASLVIVKELVASDASVQVGVMSVLDGTQRGILMKLVSIATGRAPKGRRMPRRPQASAAG